MACLAVKCLHAMLRPTCSLVLSLAARSRYASVERPCHEMPAGSESHSPWERRSSSGRRSSSSHPVRPPGRGIAPSLYVHGRVGPRRSVRRWPPALGVSDRELQRLSCSGIEFISSDVAREPEDHLVDVLPESRPQECPRQRCRPFDSHLTHPIAEPRAEDRRQELESHVRLPQPRPEYGYRSPVCVSRQLNQVSLSVDPG